MKNISENQIKREIVNEKNIFSTVYIFLIHIQFL